MLNSFLIFSIDQKSIFSADFTSIDINFKVKDGFPILAALADYTLSSDFNL